MTEKVPPVPAPRSRWYGSVRISRDGRLQFSALAFRNINRVSIWDKSPHSVDVLISGRQAMLLGPHRGRIITACFIYTLTAEEMRYAVETLRGVTGGLEGWIVPALERMQGTPTMLKPDVLEIIPELLESCRDLPVSEVWRRHRLRTQRGWVRRLRTHPEEISMVTAPWMLPEGYNPPSMASRSTAARRRQPRPA